MYLPTGITVPKELDARHTARIKSAVIDRFEIARLAEDTLNWAY